MILAENITSAQKSALGISTEYPISQIKGCIENSSRTLDEEGWRVDELKRCGNNKQGEDAYLSIVNNVHNSPC